MSLKPRIVRMPFSFLYNRLYRYVRNHYSIELYYTVTVGRRVVIGHQGAIVVHHHAAAAVGSAVFVNQKKIDLRSPRESHRLRPPADVLTIRIRSAGSMGRLGSKAGS